MVRSLVHWLEENHRELNITKTKELVIDFQRSRNSPTPITIQEEEVEIVIQVFGASHQQQVGLQGQYRRM